jgi:exodeoxyribonuclease VII large subunit
MTQNLFPSDTVFTVTNLTSILKELLESTFTGITLEGEISNFRPNTTGHLYFTLKDKNSQISAVMFRFRATSLTFVPKDGMLVRCKGTLSVYEPRGTYSIVINSMELAGEGNILLMLEQRKRLLASEGLFDESRKKPIPAFPQRVGVVTSPTGAAIRDIINVISRRFPLAELILCPVAVQGDYAAPQIKAAIELFNAEKAADVLIVGRGGGSIEELWAFNEEIVARAVAASEIPVISAVGHETDFTICDFVADLRAPTPSAAAELAVPDSFQQKEMLLSFSRRMNSAIYDCIGAQRANLELKKAALERMSPKNYIDNLCVRCDRAMMAMDSAVKQSIIVKQKEFSSLCAKLDAMSPLKILARGYGVASKEGRIISDITSVRKGDKINVMLSGGEIGCEVTEVKVN